MAGIDLSSQSSMSTNAKAWGDKKKTQGPQTDSQNTGKCDNCRYRVSKQERILYDCLECGTYIVSTIFISKPKSKIYFDTICN